MFDQDQYSLTFVSSFLTLFKLSDGAGAVWNYSQLQTEAMYDPALQRRWSYLHEPAAATVKRKNNGFIYMLRRKCHPLSLVCLSNMFQI